MRASLLFLLLLVSCHPPQDSANAPLVSIQIQDRNGLTETISVPERLEIYQNSDFLASQPYKKVLRVFKHGGKLLAKITTYHPNGFPWQYLEAQDMRAFGSYREWHPNGRLKIEATVIGGTADVVPGSQKDWLFDGVSEVWNERGELLAKILYVSGVMEGTSLYYHPNGQVEKEAPYHAGELEGEVITFSIEGLLQSKTCYRQGVKEGASVGFWPADKPSWQEKYAEGKLVEGHYFSVNGPEVSQIREGTRYQTIFSAGEREKMIEFHGGIPEGKVQLFAPNGEPTTLYHVKNGKKLGEELQYFSNEEREDKGSEKPLPKLSIDWDNDSISGIVKTWYPNGHLESQREFARNQKMGPSVTWYKDGSLMTLEEYEQDRLLKGQYFKKNQPEPTSTIVNGHGIATLFDEAGILLRKVTYVKGKPVDPES